MPLQDIQKYYSPRETQYLTHSFHRYPNKLIPQVANALIRDYSRENDTVLDVFCGSGTALVEANLLKRNAIGLDINPLACLISKAKTARMDLEELKQAAKQLLKDLWHNLKQSETLADYTNKISPCIPDFKKKDFWFQENALTGLGILKALIKRLEDENIRDFCLVAFSATIQKVSNASALYRLTRKKTLKDARKTDVYREFSKNIDSMIQAREKYDEKANDNFVRVLKTDIRDVSLKADFVIANPPAFNFDFVNSFKIYFWWLDFGDIRKLNKAMIGAKKGKALEILGIGMADEIIENIRKENPSRAAALSSYYKDMQQVFKKSCETLESGKYCCVAASDGNVCKTRIMVPEVFIQLAKKESLELVNRIKRIVPKKAVRFAKQDRVEEILVFKKQ